MKTHSAMDQWINGPMVKWSNGRMDQWTRLCKRSGTLLEIEGIVEEALHQLHQR